MTPRSRKWSSGFTVSLLVAIVLGCGTNTQEELVCEDAVSHLLDCCPGFDAHNVDCTYQPPGCGVSGVYPEIDSAQSSCIRAESCSRLQETGVCSRAEAMPNGTSWSESSAVPIEDGAAVAAEPPFPQVCP